MGLCHMWFMVMGRRHAMASVRGKVAARYMASGWEIFKERDCKAHF